METPQRIEILARGLVVGEHGILLCRNVEHGYCFLPGGHVEPGESVADALAREFLEEAGEQVRVGALCLVAEERFVQKHKARHELNLVFHVELEHGDHAAHTVQSIEPEIEFVWTPPVELMNARFLPASLVGPIVALCNDCSKGLPARPVAHFDPLLPPTAAFISGMG